MSNHVPAPGFAVLVWLCAGLLVWTGAASFIELGLTIPANGGVQEYLRVCFGEFWGFLFTWAYIAIAKPCANAIIAMVFAENLGIALNPDWTMPVWQMKVVAVVGVGLITFINCLGSMAGAKAAISFLALKLFAVFSIGIIGIGVGLGASNQDPQPLPTKWFTEDPNPDRQNMRLWTAVGEYITAVYGALFCYGGWETVSTNSAKAVSFPVAVHGLDAPTFQIGFVAGDLINPSRNLPRAITTAMIVAIIGFVLMNIALFTVLPFDVVRERSVVAVVFSPLPILEPQARQNLLGLILFTSGLRSPNFRPLGWLCVLAHSINILFGCTQCQRLRHGPALRCSQPAGLCPKSPCESPLRFARRGRTGNAESGQPSTGILRSGNTMVCKGNRDVTVG